MTMPRRAAGVRLGTRLASVAATAAVPAWRNPAHSAGLAMPLLAWVAAIGVLSVALAYDAARSGTEDESLFWLGLLLITIPVAYRLFQAHVRRTERLGLLVVTAFALYLVKVLQSPTGFTLHDEFSHLRTLSDILASGNLFEPNPLLPASPYYPGLELLTGALMGATGLGSFHAGLLVVGAARLLHVVALFLLIERLSSARAAGVGALIYVANPGFLFFDAAFSYESLALPVATAVLYCLVRWRDAEARGARWGVAAVAGIAAVAITHHLTTIFLVSVLAAWAILEGPLRSDRSSRRILVAAGVGVALNVAWLATVARPVLDYLGGVLGGALTGALRSALEGSARQLFARTPGSPTVPLWEPVLAYGAVGLILLLLPFAIRTAWRTHGSEPLMRVLMGLALLYPFTLALRFTGAGVEASQRSSEFVFIGLATILAVLARQVWTTNRLGPVRIAGWLLPIAWVAGFAVLFVGGVVVGVSPYLRLPAEYRVGADARSIDDQGLAAGAWTRDYLGPDRRIIADSANRRIQAALAGQDPVTAYGDGIGTAWLMFSGELGADDRAVLREAGIEYIIADYRLTLALPEFGVYFEPAEPDAFAHEEPIPPEAIFKFDREPRVDRLYDSGDIVIYDVSELSGVR